MKAYHTSQFSTLSSQLSSCPQRRRSRRSKFQVQSSKFQVPSSKFQVQSYVHSGHDFRRDSAKLMRASLALAAPKIQSSNLQAGVTSMKAYHTSQFSTLRGSGAAGSKFKVQGSNALKRVQGSKLHTDSHRFTQIYDSSKFKVQSSRFKPPPTPPRGRALSHRSHRTHGFCFSCSKSP